MLHTPILADPALGNLRIMLSSHAPPLRYDHIPIHADMLAKLYERIDHVASSRTADKLMGIYPR
ncbi:MAG: hypothetical protein EOM14_11795, partial [Clostridia bacterium]|nr:hypothetical protein [Clostridia bacterium]